LVQEQRSWPAVPVQSNADLDLGEFDGPASAEAPD